jgi:hypothetical protein
MRGANQQRNLNDKNMNNLFKFIGALAVMASVITASAQNYTGVPTLVSNYLNSGASSTVPSSVVLNAGPKATVWITYQVLTNNPSYTMGTGVVTFIMGASASTTTGPLVAITPPVGSPYTQTYTNSPFTLNGFYSLTGQNIVTNQAVFANFDASGIQGLGVISMANYSTNAIVTNLLVQCSWRQ